jgi:cyclopropane-fatty-acyl-phospholipid synthase
MRVLEIGCGWGGFAEHASQQGIAVHGITISDAQLEFAQRRLAGKPLVQLEWWITATCTASTMPLFPSKCSKP